MIMGGMDMTAQSVEVTKFENIASVVFLETCLCCALVPW